MWQKYGKIIVFILVILLVVGAVYWRTRPKSVAPKQVLIQTMIDRSNYGLYGQLAKSVTDVPATFQTPSVWLFDNDADWKRFWDNYIRQANTGGFSGAPTVDFGRELVLAVLQGIKPTGGYYVTIEGVALVGSDLEIYSTMGQPTESEAVAQALSAPYDITKIMIDKNQLANSTVRLQAGGQEVVAVKFADVLNRKI